MGQAQPSLDRSISGTFPTSNFRVFASDLGDGYLIAGLTWLMIHRRYPNAETADAVKKMVAWVLTKGQPLNNSLNYSRIPEPVTRRALQAVNSQVTSP